MMDPKVTPAAMKALRKASQRPRGNICPIVGVVNAAEDKLLASLDRNGWVDWDGPVPRISSAGRSALAQAEPE